MKKMQLLKENLVYSYLISLPNNYSQEYSIKNNSNFNLSIDQINNKQIFTLLDNSFKQTISLSSNDIKKQFF